MKKLLAATIIGLASAFSLVTANVALAADTAAPLKIGVVDLQQIVQKSPQMVKINAQLEKEFKPRSNNLLNLRKNIQSQADKLKKDGAVMSNADREALQNKINNDSQQFQKQFEEFQKDLAQAEKNAREKFGQQVLSAINTVANNDKYDMILQKSAAPFASSKLDITNQVLDVLKKS